jgi:hypothetical protein
MNNSSHKNDAIKTWLRIKTVIKEEHRAADCHNGGNALEQELGTCGRHKE